MEMPGWRESPQAEGRTAIHPRTRFLDEKVHSHPRAAESKSKQDSEDNLSLVSKRTASFVSFVF